MRIVAGRLKGRRLDAPAGDHVRPTADRARETLFALLEGGRFNGPDGSPAVAGRRVLDIFAGSGALGLEAWSRGADSVVFVERDRAALQSLRRNRALAPADAAIDIVAGDALRPGCLSGAIGGRAAGLILLDPPYGRALATDALSRIDQEGIAAPGALIVAETGRDETLAIPGTMSPLESRRVGAAAFHFLRING